MRRPVTALDLKDRNLALAPRQGLEISFGACLWVSPRLRDPLNMKQVKFISLSSTLSHVVND